MKSALVLAALAAAISLAHAEGGRRLAAPALPAYQKECGACHAAYPPGLLPAASWRRITADLAHHFGTDASLDPAGTQRIAAYLAANAGTSRRGGEAPPPDRITRAAWFGRQHAEVPAAIWRSPAVKSAANCAACHPRAAEGDFDEDRVLIPR
jgi:hypothetical protein